MRMTHRRLDYEQPIAELFIVRAHNCSLLVNFSLTGEVDEFGDYETF